MPSSWTDVVWASLKPSAASRMCRADWAKRSVTARDIQLAPDEAPLDGPWTHGKDGFRVPYLFVTNGRPYVKQLATKSGIWFWDARPAGGEPRALPEWFSPRDLKERLEQVPGDLTSLTEQELGVTGLRPYQNEAIAAVEAAIAGGQQNILLAMATGTGKTRLAIALMYDLLRRNASDGYCSSWTVMRSAVRRSMQ